MEQSAQPQEDDGWDTNTRILHWLLVGTVTFQLLSSLFMADVPTQFLFPIHELIGLATGACVVVFWIHVSRNGDLRILLPWNQAGAAAIGRDLFGLLRGRLPPAGRRVGLSSFVHGLGLLALTGSGFTGLILFFLAPLGSHAGPSDAVDFTNMSLDHKFFGELIWAYLIGHVLFALLHQFRSGHVLGGIFRFPSEKRPGAD
ncbi:MAG: cytochrome b/b6 domain-containing protein [Gammaproteobacteria bacterium]|nr:cytochrome b/b6 domain-containing protein [Gammaproteobacteria bacterium]